MTVQDKEKFLSDTRHDLRTPINHIIGYSEMLFEDAQEAHHEDAAVDLQKIFMEGKNLLEIVNTRFESSQFESSQMSGIHDEMMARIDPLVPHIETLLKKASGSQQKDFESDLQRIKSALDTLRAMVEKLCIAQTKSGG